MLKHCLVAAILLVSVSVEVMAQVSGKPSNSTGSEVMNDNMAAREFHFGAKLWQAVQPIAESAEDAEELEAMSRSTSRFWARTEFMLWWVKSANLPPLVTTGEFSEPRPGALDSLSTKVLFGQQRMDFQDRGGGRFALGGWIDSESIWGLEANYFFLRGRSIGRTFSSAGEPVLAIPFFNADTATADSLLITYPGVMSGHVAVSASTFLQSSSADLTAVLYRTENSQLSTSIGFRQLNLDERLHINASSLVELAPQYVGLLPLDGNTINVSDRFETENHFYGGQIGALLELHRKRWTLALLGKVALGATRQIILIRGSTEIDTQPTVVENGGLFAVSSNSGTFGRSVFAVVPEAGFKLKFQLTNRVQIFGGYSLLYWNSVVRPGDQVDTRVNPNLVPSSFTFNSPGGAPLPAFSFRTTSFFAHGANFGIELRY